MRISAIGDELMVQALRLIGIEGEVVETAGQAEAALDAALGSEKVILICQAAADLIREKVDELKLARRDFVVLEVPSREGKPRQAEETARLISQAIGIRV